MHICTVIYREYQKQSTYLEVGISSAGALGRAPAAVGLVEQEAEDVQQEHDGHDVQVGEQALQSEDML
jgi:shikimate kinase